MDGRKVRIICYDKKEVSCNTIVALIEDANVEHSFTYFDNGNPIQRSSFGAEAGRTLILRVPKPKKRKVVKWAVSFCSSDSKERFMSVGLYDTFEEAQDAWCDYPEAECMFHKIEWEEEI